jgi:hypothetical protein
MHANALGITRQCVEAISSIELSLACNFGCVNILKRWDCGKIKAGDRRKWLSENLWKSYGSGIWDEPWAEFMHHFSAAFISDVDKKLLLARKVCAQK